MKQSRFIDGEIINADKDFSKEFQKFTKKVKKITSDEKVKYEMIELLKESTDSILRLAIDKIADFLEINDIGKQNGGNSFLAYFCEYMPEYLMSDKTNFKEQLKYYREHGELPMPKEINYKK